MKHWINFVVVFLCTPALYNGLVHISSLVASSSHQAVGAKVEVMGNITITNKWDYPVSINWHYKGPLIASIHMTNETSFRVKCRRTLCYGRAVVSATTLTISPYTVVLHKFTIKELEQSDNRGVVILSHRLNRRSVTLSVSACLLPSIPGAFTKTSKPICGLGCTVTYRCQTGYNLISDNSTTAQCMGNGTLDNTPSIQCKITTCAVASVVDDTIAPLVFAATIPYNHRLKFLCKVGYRGVGTTYVCDAFGDMILTSAPALCKTIICYVSSIADQTIAAMGNVKTAKFNERVQFECKTGYIGIGASYVCNAVGKFTLTSFPAVCVERIQASNNPPSSFNSKKTTEETSTPIGIIISIMVLCVVLVLFVLGILNCKIPDALKRRSP